MAIAGATKPRGPAAKLRQLAHAWISNEAYAAIAEAAAERGEHVDLVVARLLERIAGERRVLEAVLDREPK